MKRLLLVFPTDTAITYGDLRHVSHLTGRTGGVLNASLATVAALTPPGVFDITIVDEHVSAIDFDGDWDVVGLTGFPTQIHRARQIAAEFRRRGVLVVAGGPSVSVSPNRWREFCDVLFVGLAERTWPRFVRDYAQGRWEPEYVEPDKLGLEQTPPPDYSGFDPKTLPTYNVAVVQTSRGCPFNCEFCDAIVYLGRKMRYKPIATIEAELRQIVAMGIRFVYLADDNFAAGRKKAKAILRAFIAFNQTLPSPLSFYATISIDAAKDAEFLELAARANMLRILVGLETPNEASLREADKLQNVKNDVPALVRRFQEHGIQVHTGAIVGFDSDGLDIFERQVRFFAEMGVTNVYLYPLQAPDGTPLKARLEREGRYLDWDAATRDSSVPMNNFNTLSMVPKQMTTDQLIQGTYWAIRELYSFEAMTERLRVFLDVYEQGPRPRVPRLPFDRYNAGVVLRLVRHVATEATAEQRRALFELLGVARRSSHPQSLGFAVAAYLLCLNVQALMREHVPEIASVTLPRAISDVA